MVAPISLTCFLFAFICLLAIFVLYPLYLYLHPASRRIIPPPKKATLTPRISVIVVAHNASALVKNKIHNCLALDYPIQHLEFFFCSDGSTDQTVDVIRPFISPHLHLLSYEQHRGKASVINDVVKRCSGELLLFSDTDALLDRNCLKLVSAHFDDASIGGVSGARVIEGSDNSSLIEPQQSYIFADSVVKILESRIGSTTSNDGKLYIIRNELFRPIHPAATDDLFICLNVVSQGKRFIYEPRAQAVIRKPSMDMAHEIRRRRRIVCRSLTGIWSMRRILNPMRFRAFAVGLFINKVLRRALPFLLVTLLLSSFLLALDYADIWPLFIIQALFYLLAGLKILADRLSVHLPTGLDRSAAVAAYFCVGNLGTMLGIIDFARGTRYVTWEPLKAHPPE